MENNPCLECGACCAFFRASFYWAECDDATPGGVPESMTEKLSDFRRVMKGTNRPNPRCMALNGIIGRKVFCGIHPRRASVCRDFAASWIDGRHNADCDRARAHWGLGPLSPDAWLGPGDVPKVA
jgi:Fe-S-cluster containining protein